MRLARLNIMLQAPGSFSREGKLEGIGSKAKADDRIDATELVAILIYLNFYFHEPSHHTISPPTPKPPTHYTST